MVVPADGGGGGGWPEQAPGGLADVLLLLSERPDAKQPLSAAENRDIRQCVAVSRGDADAWGQLQGSGPSTSAVTKCLGDLVRSHCTSTALTASGLYACLLALPGCHVGDGQARAPPCLAVGGLRVGRSTLPVNEGIAGAAGSLRACPHAHSDCLYAMIGWALYVQCPGPLGRAGGGSPFMG